MHVNHQSESWRSLLYYWITELLILIITIALPPLFDAYLLAKQHSVVTYGAFGLAANLLHFLTKIAEALPVAAIALIGFNNGARDTAAVGKNFVACIWAAVMLGVVQYLAVHTGASTLYHALGATPEMTTAGAPYLQLRALAMLLTFIALTALAFLRALKNTTMPLIITASGCLLSMGVSAWLIPACGPYGAAYAALAQYGYMCLAAGLFIALNPAYHPLRIHMHWHAPDWSIIRLALWLSLPTVFDKASLSLVYLWLARHATSVGTHALAAFEIIKNMHRFCIMPTLACAQIAIMLVSNYWGAGALDTLRTTLRTILWWGCGVAGILLVITCVWATPLATLLSPDAAVTVLAAPLLQWLALGALLDCLQIIYAGALRGMRDVTFVMIVRIGVLALFFLPVSYILSGCLPLHATLQVGAVYGTFYLSTGIMAFIFWYRMQQGTCMLKRKDTLL